MNKKGIEFGFSWIFAIIAGAVILFSAIYITTRLIGSERQTSNTFVASELTNLLNPIETNLEDSKYVTIDFIDETRVFNDCSTQGAFGKQQISTASKLGIGDEWGRQSVRVTSFNKYVFSRSVEETEGRKLHAIVKPFNLPFKIGDVTMLYGKRYCFVNPPSELEDELLDLSGQQNDIGINISDSLGECVLDTTSVCFDQLGCDISVNTQAGIVSSAGQDLYYHDQTLQLAAILSDPFIYECQLKRLMDRAGELSAVYARKASYIESSGCPNSLGADLQAFGIATAITTSRELVQRVVPLAEQLEERNGNLAACTVF